MLLQADGPQPDMKSPPTSEMASRPPSDAGPGDTYQGNNSAAVRGEEQEQGWKMVGPRSPRRTSSSASRRFGRTSSGMTWSFRIPSHESADGSQ